MERHVRQEISRSKILTYKGNDLTVEVGGTVTMDHVTLSGGGDHNIAIYTNGTLRLRNSIVQRVRAPGSALLSNAGVLISDNVLWYEKGAAKPASFLSPTDLWEDPQFVDAAEFNFQLKSTSPAIDRASTGSAAGPNDLNYNARIAGNAADLGAYEFQGSQPAPNPGPMPVPSLTPVSTLVPTSPIDGKMKTKESKVPVPVVPAPLPSATSVLIGLSAGQTVGGTIFVQPNPNLVPGLTKVSYFLNGKKSGKTKNFPFVWGGSDGFDTTKLADGTYILQGICQTPAGEQTFSITFQVTNPH